MNPFDQYNRVRKEKFWLEDHFKGKGPSIVYVDTKNNQSRVVPPVHFKMEGVA